MSTDLDKMNKKVIPDLLTGGEQTVYWNNEGTFMLCIPHKGIPLPDGDKHFNTKLTNNKYGTKSWEIVYDNPENK